MSEQVSLEDLTTAMSESFLGATKMLHEVVDHFLDDKTISLQDIQKVGAVATALTTIHGMMIDAYIAKGLGADEVIRRVREALGG